MESAAQLDPPSTKAAAAVTLCGVCAFLELYCTQPLLPLLAHIFHASKTGVGMTVSAATLGVAIAAPVFGALTERLPRKRVIVFSILGVSLPTLLAATSTSLAQLIFWRFLQGIMVPGIIAVVVTYIGEEWPPERVALIMSFYVSGTALGGFIGRISAGILADHFSWRASFLALGIASLVGTAAVAAWLPNSRRRTPHNPSAVRAAFVVQVQQMFRSRRLVATFAVGFNVLFSLVGVFTWITFYLAVPPFSLSTTALSSLFFVYLIGLIVTPFAGYLITRIGLRAGIGGAISCAIAGVLLTLAHSLPIVILGLAALSSGVFIAQTASQSHLRVASPPEARVTAAGIYITCYYLGGTAAGVVPGAFWAWGKWPACVAFIVFMQLIALTIALLGWRTLSPVQSPAPSASSVI
ncbi:MFS transporter [Occallatibacter savannae]|uniref:MFS transporter n=1 Tax=Occallatibacter savannae TaxID=1002691 RepID=UPI000D686AA6|nr:MFS transporter [Occallatibacter savannae]